jgi:hypothetical protein
MIAIAKKKASYEAKVVENSENHLRRRFRLVSMGRELRRAAAGHEPADWEVLDSAGKIEALVQVKASRHM